MTARHTKNEYNFLSVSVVPAGEHTVHNTITKTDSIRVLRPSQRVFANYRIGVIARRLVYPVPPDSLLPFPPTSNLS